MRNIIHESRRCGHCLHFTNNRLGFEICGNGTCTLLNKLCNMNRILLFCCDMQTKTDKFISRKLFKDFR